MISPSDTSAAEPRSQTLRVALFSETWIVSLAPGARGKQERIVQTHQNIVRLDVRVDIPAFAHQRQRQEQLVRVCPDGSHVEPNILAEALDDVAQVHAIR